MHAAVAGGLDIMRHVADECGMFRAQGVVFQQVVDVFSFVSDAGMNTLEIRIQCEFPRLSGEVVRMSGAEHEAAMPLGLTPAEEVAGVGQKSGLFFRAHEGGVKNGFEGSQHLAGQQALVKPGKRQFKFPQKVFAGQYGAAAVRQHCVSGINDRREVVDKRAGPVENEISEMAHAVVVWGPGGVSGGD